MSEEGAFLDAIAADRADRTRLLVFADWLAERDDPREEFIRLHARLLDVDGTEPEFEKLDEQWGKWVGGNFFAAPHRPKLNARWLDALCRVCTTTDVEEYAEKGRDPESILAEMTEYGNDDHYGSGEQTLILYRGDPLDYPTPFEFVSQTLLVDLWQDPFLDEGKKALAKCYPLTRGRFWLIWQEKCVSLRNPPPMPALAADNHFLSSQFIDGDWNNWGMVAIHQNDYFALFWCTTA
jgi:uncharacterized protein (TIGR02996 family)